MKTETISPSKERLTALQECEQKIITQFRRGLEATCAIAREFRKINEQELYTDCGYLTFNEYLDRRLGLGSQTVRRIVAVSYTVENLRKAGMALPENETQAAELARVEPEHQPIVWQLVLQEAERLDKRVTATAVRDAVKSYELHRSEEPDEPATPAPRPGVKTALDTESPSDVNGAPKKTAAKVPERITLTEKGEAALERIGRLCGEPIAKGILSGNLPISERELLKWAEQSDDLVLRLAHYVSDLRWPVARALTFEQRTLNEATTLAELITLAKARGGRYSEVTEHYELTLELA